MMRRNESTFKEFVRTTYRSGSPIPYIITIKVAVFVLIHIFDLFYELKATDTPLYYRAVSQLSLPNDFELFLHKPWTLFTYPFVYTGLFQILFDCLWLFWISTIFLNLLHVRQLSTIYFGALLFSGIIYLILGQINFLADSPQTSLYTGSVGIAAILSSLIVLVPKTEIRLFLLGNVQLRVLGIIYLVMQFIYFALTNRTAAATFLFSVGWGILFMSALQRGQDYSTIFRKKSKKLKVVHRKVMVSHSNTYIDEVPAQEVIDDILDKISVSGYDSLTKKEKDTLFKASKQEND